MEIIEAPAFTRYCSKYLNAEEYRELQNELVLHPEAGDVVPGCGGFRKLRWVDPRRGKGRRGGLRIIYYYFRSDQQIWLVTLYGKNEAIDSSAQQKKVLRSAIETELAARQAARGGRRKGPSRTS